MKQLLFIFLSLSPLWVYSSCEDEDKLPGSKPEILLGKWENLSTISDGIGWFGSFTAGYRKEIYEFTEKSGSVIQLDSLIEDNKYKEHFIRHFTDWSYDGDEIYFIEKKGKNTNRWSKPVSELTSDYFKLGVGGSVDIYFKVK
jgi:hypothetical protein